MAEAERQRANSQADAADFLASAPSANLAPSLQSEAGESVLPSASSQSAGQAVQKESTWKVFSRRRDGDHDYKFGDISRGVMLMAAEAVRDVRHKGAEVGLNLQESLDKHISSRAVDLLKEHGAEGGEHQSPKVEGSVSDATRAERWWCQVCRMAHEFGQVSAEDLRIPPSNARGKVNIKVLAFGCEGSEGTVLDGSGSAAEQPVCQLSVEEKLTGGFEVTKDTKSGADPHEGTDVATFYFSELIGCDLRVHVWDQRNARFIMGFEDKGFCGGGFVPLSTIVQRCSRSLKQSVNDQLHREVFEAKVKVTLLPLPLIRAKYKLEAADTSGAKELPKPHGWVLLRVRLQLFEPPARLRVAEPVLVATNGLTGGVIHDPANTLKSAGGAIGRTGKAANFVPLLSKGFDTLREEFLTLIALQLWWALTALKAPLCCWPALITLLLPAFSWACQKNCSVLGGTDAKFELYVDRESKSPGGMEQVHLALHGAAKVQQTILQLSDNLTSVAAEVERVRYALSGEDPFLSGVLAGGVFVGSIFAGIGVQMLLWLASWGLLRYIVWVVGTCALLPRSLRDLQLMGAIQLAKLINEAIDDKASRMAKALWQRIPDSVETTHVALCERHVLEVTPVIM